MNEEPEVFDAVARRVVDLLLDGWVALRIGRSATYQKSREQRAKVERTLSEHGRNELARWQTWSAEIEANRTYLDEWNHTSLDAWRAWRSALGPERMTLLHRVWATRSTQYPVGARVLRPGPDDDSPASIAA